MVVASLLPVRPVAPRHSDGTSRQSVWIPADSPGALITSTGLTHVPACLFLIYCRSSCQTSEVFQWLTRANHRCWVFPSRGLQQDTVSDHAVFFTRYCVCAYTLYLFFMTISRTYFKFFIDLKRNDLHVIYGKYSISCRYITTARYYFFYCHLPTWPSGSGS